MQESLNLSNRSTQSKLVIRIRGIELVWRHLVLFCIEIVLIWKTAAFMWPRVTSALALISATFETYFDSKISFIHYKMWAILLCSVLIRGQLYTDLLYIHTSHMYIYFMYITILCLSQKALTRKLINLCSLCIAEGGWCSQDTLYRTTSQSTGVWWTL